MTRHLARRTPRRAVVPGFGFTMGLTLLYLSLVVLIPLAGVLVTTSGLTAREFWGHVSGPRALASYRLTFTASLIAAATNAACGLLVAWVLVRYRFPGRRALDAMVDLPFALPTAVAGICLTAVYAPDGWLGRLLQPLGVQVAFTRLGVVVALMFVGLPFVVRTVQPVIQDIDHEVEEAAASLGATPRQVFARVVLPTVAPAVLTGFALAFARALGEYGSVIFISGNLPMKTEITTLLIMSKLEQYDYAGATAVATLMLAASFLLLVAINLLQRFSRLRAGAEA